MIRSAIVLAAVAFATFGSVTQAAQAPVQPIVDTCSPPEQSAEVDKACADLVDAYIVNATSSPNQTTELGDLAYNLASLPLVDEPLCIRISREVGKLGDATPDGEQAATLQGISATVLQCQAEETAALLPPGAVLPTAASATGPNG